MVKKRNSSSSKLKWPLIFAFVGVCIYNAHWFYRPFTQRIAYSWFTTDKDGEMWTKYEPGASTQSIRRWINDVDDYGFAEATNRHRLGMAEYASRIAHALRSRTQAKMFGIDPEWLDDEFHLAAADFREGDINSARRRYWKILLTAIPGVAYLEYWNLLGLDYGDVEIQTPHDWPQAAVVPPADKRAFVLVFYGNKTKYILEMAFLIRSLRKFDTETPMIILATPDVNDDTRAILRGYGYEIHDIPANLTFPEAFLARLKREANTTHQGNFRKLFAWTVNKVTGRNYEKVILLDGDMIILKDIKRLFACPAEFCAAVEVEPTPDKFHINSGLMVIKPSMDTFNELVRGLGPYTRSLFFSEQSYLSDYFPRDRPEKSIVLDSAYNYCTPNDINEKEVETGGVAVYHFCSNIFWCFECMPVYSELGLKSKHDAGAEIRETYTDMFECGKYDDEQTCSAYPGCYYCGHQILPCMAKDHAALCHHNITVLDGPVPFLTLVILILALIA